MDLHSLPNEIRPGAELWQVVVPAGHSSPIVANGQVYLTASANGELLTIAIESKTGKEVWRQRAPRNRKEHLDKRNHPASPTPAADRDKVVVFFPDFGLLAYSHTGRKLWHTPLGRSTTPTEWVLPLCW